MSQAPNHYPNLQAALGINSNQAASTVELANRINTAQDIIARHPDSEPGALQAEIDDATRYIDVYLGRAAAANNIQKPEEPAAPKPPRPAYKPRRPLMVVNTDGREVPYGQMTPASGPRHPQTGRIIYR